MGIKEAVLMFWMVSGPPPGAYIETENLRRPILPWSQTVAPSPLPGAHPGAPSPHSGAAPGSYYWAAFESVLDDSLLARVSALGVEVLGFAGRPGPYLLYKIRIGRDPAPVAGSLSDSSFESAFKSSLESLKALDSFVNLFPVLPAEKVTRKVLQGRFKSILPDGRVKATVFFHRRLTPSDAGGLLAGRVDGFQVDPGGHAGVHVIASPARVLALADLDEVARVEDYVEPLPLGPGKHGR